MDSTYPNSTQLPSEIIDFLIAEVINPFSIYDRQGKLLFVNEKMANLMRQLDMNTASFFTQFCHSPDQAAFISIWQSVLDGEIVSFSTQSEFSVIEWSLRLHENQNSIFLTSRYVTPDISHWHFQQRALQLAAIFNQTSFGIAFVSLSGEIFQFNSKFSEMFDISFGDSLTIQSLIHPEEISINEHLYRLAIDHSPSYSQELRCWRNNQIFWVRLTASLVPSISELQSYFVVILDDISEPHCQAN